MNPLYKNIMTLALGMLVLLAILTFWSSEPREPREALDWNDFVAAVDQGQIETVRVRDQEIEGEFKPEHGGKTFESYGPIDDQLRQALYDKGVSLSFERPKETGLWHTILITWFPMLLLVGLFFLVFRQMQAGGGKAMSFGKSRARLLSDGQQNITFADVAGVDEAKAELEEIVAFLRDPKKFTRLGGRIPKGVLLVGAPGTGKTLLARAIAGEAGVPFFSISGSDFVEMFVGVGASRVRDLFLQGKKNAPCIIFVDEIDAVGRHRGAGLGGGHDEREQTLNQLLVEMDGFESNEGVIIIAATNRPDVLDPAMLRPGRFDRHVVVSAPDLRGREAILRVHARKVLLGSEVDLRRVARGTPGFSGADLENLVNEAALLAARRDGDCVDGEDFDQAKDKVLMGTERRSLTLSDHERRVTAFHEAGHALVAMLQEDHDPLHKVSIIPRGRALGVTLSIPTEDRYTATGAQLMASIAFCMGGRAAEELVFGQLSTGASDDLRKATKIARDMVCCYGMSERLGPMSIEASDHQVFLGRELGQGSQHSEGTAQAIDQEVQRILQTAYDRALNFVTERRDALDKIAAGLLERETLDDRELNILLEGGELPRLEEDVPPAPPEASDDAQEKAKETREPRFGDKGNPLPEPLPS